MLNPFGRAKELESQVDQFLDLITKGTFCMREAIGSYLGGDDEDFQSRLDMVRDYERRADELKASTETMLYTHSLIPESRADVLELLEKLDDVIDRAKQIVQEFDVQRPDVEVGYFDLFVQLTDKSVRAVEQVVSAARAFFGNESQLRDFINKVDFYESEADRIGLRLKKQIFQSDAELSRKHHLRFFADILESLSDLAEDVSNRLAIATIKRSP